MAKTPAFTPKPAIEKLPLAVRKSVRDDFESKKAEFEEQIAKLLSVPAFKINYDVPAIWAYNAPDSRSEAGYTLKSYTEGFISALTYYLEKYGDDGKQYFNDAVPQAELSLGVNTLGDKGAYIDAEITDGVFRILFKHDSLGCNTSSLGEYLLKAVQSVPREGLSIVAKNSVDSAWEEEVEELTEEIATLVGIPDVKLDPNFEENYKMLSSQKNTDWHSQLGPATLAYFKDGLKYQLERQGFKDDDMLQEGLQEVFTSKAFVLRVVPKTKKTYNEVVIEDGTVYLQVSPIALPAYLY
ncbi:hypothetical protein CPB85DRAFT_1213595 [Mucidula mucida]|nr:hypothetical protein CPB85DRAFT_1213595 [Mucidula mucida]